MMQTPMDDTETSPLTQQIGFSRPPLEVEDLPTPEEAFRVRRVGFGELVLLILGPSVIALGLSIGSGEWLHIPLRISAYGFKGLGWVLLVSAVLQVFYNVELARFTLATGESPLLAFGRTPPGFLLWVPLALIFIILAFITGSWVVDAGRSLFVLTTGRLDTLTEQETVRLMGIGLMLVAFLIALLGRKIERTMEAVQGILLSYILIGLVTITLIVVPFDYWRQALASLVVPALPPQGTDPSLLGTLAGYVAIAAGLNFMFIGYYRDKGFGMGSKTGFIPGLLGGQRVRLSPSGKIFPEDEKNASIWKRWFGYLLVDQWAIYFVGLLIGMTVPSILVGYLSTLSGNIAAPNQDSIFIYAAAQLGQTFGAAVTVWILLLGFLILFSTQVVILELLARNLTEALYGTSSRVRTWAHEDPRRLYYLLMALLIVFIGIIIHLTLPIPLRMLSANLPFFAAMIFPLVMIYLNRKLPKPARITWWSYLVLVANVLFFGFFCLNFLSSQFLGAPLVRF